MLMLDMLDAVLMKIVESLLKIFHMFVFVMPFATKSVTVVMILVT